MLRAFLARIGLGRSSPDQLELGLGAAAPVSEHPNSQLRERDVSSGKRATASRREREGRGRELLARLQSYGMRDIDALRLTQNRATMVSFRGRTLRVHEAFTHASEEVQRAIAVFVSGRGAARRAAKQVILGHRIERAPQGARRPPAQHPDDAALAARLTAEHARLNAAHFGGTLRPVHVRVSRRMKTRLGHFAPGGAHAGDIVISRRHIRRHGWSEAFATLLHEMVHQWQEESALPLDHGPAFRRKAREVGVTPSAKRILR